MSEHFEEALDAAGPVLGTLIVDDHEMVARAIAATLERLADFRLVGVATSIEQAVEVAATRQPDLIVTDLRLGTTEVVDHLPRLRAAAPLAKVLVISGVATDRSVLQVLRAGADGYVTKTQPLRELVAAARRVADGGVVFPASALQTVLERGGVVQPAVRPHGIDLTPRELDVVQLLALGHDTAGVAAELHVAVNTVRNHLASAMAKLGASNRLGAVAEALRRGLVSPPQVATCV